MKDWCRQIEEYLEQPVQAHWGGGVEHLLAHCCHEMLVCTHVCVYLYIHVVGLECGPSCTLFKDKKCFSLHSGANSGLKFGPGSGPVRRV